MKLITLFALCCFVFVIHATTVPITHRELNSQQLATTTREKRSLLLAALGAGALGIGIIGAKVVGAGLIGAKVVGAGLIGAGAVGLAKAGLVGAGLVGAKAGLAASALAGASRAQVHYHRTYLPAPAPDVKYEAEFNYRANRGLKA